MKSIKYGLLAATALFAMPALAASVEKIEGGVIVTVAIADVSWYVRPGSALDREALKRGNSVYFPDRVVPMLPENISNDLCSLCGCFGRRLICADTGFLLSLQAAVCCSIN